MMPYLNCIGTTPILPVRLLFSLVRRTFSFSRRVFYRPGASLGVPLLLALISLAGCQNRGTTATAAPPTQAATAPAAATPTTPPGPAFSGKDAYAMLKGQCDLGPRPPGSVAHTQCKAYILKELTPYVDSVVKQSFTFRDSDRHVTLNLTNILGVINPGASRKIMLFTHWDTRPTSDQDIDAANKKKPIAGANDGASGTAVLLELARALHEKKPDVCVELLFVDGEDWGPGEEKMYLGASYFAAHPGANKPEYAILLDMIGDKDLDVHREITSERLHAELNDKVWNAAAALGYQAQFPNDTKYQISDDHDSFNNAGIPAIDLIDFDYAFWHTQQDTADKCSARSLKVVGDIMETVLYGEK